jgi:hypothetical protein
MATRAQRYATAARRWAFLREWIGVLQEHLYYHEREELAGGTLHSGLRSFCVYIPWPPAATDEYEHKLTRLREAMELVALSSVQIYWLTRVETYSWGFLPLLSLSPI